MEDPFLLPFEQIVNKSEGWHWVYYFRSSWIIMLYVYFFLILKCPVWPVC